MRRKYRISGLTSQATRELIFPVDERGTMKSVVEYFYETYGFVIQHAQLPCLQVDTALLKVACQQRQEREQDIMQTVHPNAYHEDPYAKEFGIKISEWLAQVEARILSASWLKYHDTGREKDCLPQVGQWNMMNKKMVNGGTFNHWICINFSRNVQDGVARGFCYELAQMCFISGMAFNPEPVLPPITARPDQVEKVLKTRYHDAMTKLQPQKKELDLLIGIPHSTLHMEYWRLIDPQGKPTGVMGWWPSRAVAFLENHDTGSHRHIAITTANFGILDNGHLHVFDLSPTPNPKTLFELVAYDTVDVVYDVSWSESHDSSSSPP
ncbi:hypothetical protein FNV43_RR02087 [Rhamnella rubrinervis]|uniref:PAZ domain-containing protein n=1 Tax=Rhamnella rubrinervis TaxID=2594499 RepID=A0A8K0MTG5_9ROSA|nr:hypothetical protein FNV43_RR02087 [Rhamnella rubrinervis]